MTYLKRLSSAQLREVKTSTVAALLIIALLGFADATYLTVEHYRGVIPPCSIVEGCEQVLTSDYSIIVGIPVSLLGSIFYLAISIGTFVYLESRHGGGKIHAHHSQILKWTLLTTLLGFVFSMWFLYAQVFIIGAYCLYCLGSILTSTVLFIMSMEIFKNYAYVES